MRAPPRPRTCPRSTPPTRSRPCARQIDAVDAAIIRLVAERARLSSRIQAARVSSGGTRVELGRERVILDAYRSQLGANGPHLADAILQVCRGNR